MAHGASRLRNLISSLISPMAAIFGQAPESLRSFDNICSKRYDSALLEPSICPGSSEVNELPETFVAAKY